MIGRLARQVELGPRNLSRLRNLAQNRDLRCAEISGEILEVVFRTLRRRRSGLRRGVVRGAAALQESKFDHERGRRHDAAAGLDQLAGGAHRAAGRQQVVDDQHPFAGLDRIDVDLDGVGAGTRARSSMRSSSTAACRACAPARSRRRAASPAARRTGSRATRSPPTLSTRPTSSFASRSIATVIAAGDASSGVMSLKRMPGLGKSGTSRRNLPRSMGG